MRWNMRLTAAEQGIWKSAELRRRFAEAGLEISAGKMSALWTGTPTTIRLEDLEVICDGFVPAAASTPLPTAVASTATPACRGSGSGRFAASAADRRTTTSLPGCAAAAIAKDRCAPVVSTASRGP